jgi:hypothetical protein
VAVGDLVGGLTPLYALAGGEDATGLADAFRNDLPLSEIARPVPGEEGIFILPAGTPPAATRELFAHTRWAKLTGGFTRAGGLLLLIARPDAPGLEQLAAAGVQLLRVGARRSQLEAFREIAAVESPTEPSATGRAAGPAGLGPARSMRRRVLPGAPLVPAALGAAIIGGALGVWVTWHRTAEATAYVVPPRPAPLTAAGIESRGESGPAVPGSDTLLLAPVATGADSAEAAPFAVEIVATSTSLLADSLLRDGARVFPLPAATISPVILGSGAGSVIWHRVVVGASAEREGADSLLAELRRRGVVGDAGEVVRVPWALLLADRVSRARALAIIEVWRARGFGAYALEQRDGRVRVYVGAFATPGQSVALAAEVRDAGHAPVPALRTGRPI